MNAIEKWDKERAAFKPALEAYQNSVYGSHIVRLGEAIEAYNKVPEAMALSDDLKKEADAALQENVKLKNALKAIYHIQGLPKRTPKNDLKACVEIASWALGEKTDTSDVATDEKR